MTLFGWTFKVGRGYPKPAGGQLFRTPEDAAYHKGLDHGINKERARIAHMIDRVETIQAQRDRFEQKHKAEVAQHLSTIRRVRALLYEFNAQPKAFTHKRFFKELEIALNGHIATAKDDISKNGEDPAPIVTDTLSDPKEKP